MIIFKRILNNTCDSAPACISAPECYIAPDCYRAPECYSPRGLQCGRAVVGFWGALWTYLKWCWTRGRPVMHTLWVHVGVGVRVNGRSKSPPGVYPPGGGTLLEVRRINPFACEPRLPTPLLLSGGRRGIGGLIRLNRQGGSQGLPPW